MLSRVLGVLAVSAVVLTSCAPAPTASPSAPAAPSGGEKRSEKQVLHVAQIGLPATMSPEASASNIPLFAAMYDPLVFLDAKNNVIPWAAEKWSQPNPTTWRFTLRKDLTFSNGDKLTAADVEFTMNTIVEQKFPQISQVLNMTGAKMVDDYTVDVMTKIPDASVVPGLLYCWIMPKNYYTQQGKSGFASKPIGSGPYELVDFRANDIATFKLRGTKHPFRDSAATDLTVRSITEQTQMQSGLQTGDLDIAVGALRPDVVDAIAKSDAKVEYRTTTNISALLSQPENKTRNTPLTDKTVRLALNYAVDKDAIAKNLFKGYAKPTGQMVNPDSPAWDPAVQPVPYDPKKAKELLAQAGYPNGFKLPVGIEFTPQTVDPNIALAIQSNLKDVGVDAPVTPFELAAFLDKYYGRNGQSKGDIFIQAASDNNGFFNQGQGLYTCNKELPWWCSSVFDQNMALANAEPDVAKRTEYMRKAVHGFTDDVAHINLIISSNFLITSAKTKGFVWENTFFYVWDKVYKID